jgi:hypothetical protein
VCVFQIYYFVAWHLSVVFNLFFTFIGGSSLEPFPTDWWFGLSQRRNHWLSTVELIKKATKHLDSRIQTPSTWVSHWATSQTVLLVWILSTARWAMTAFDITLDLKMSLETSTTTLPITSITDTF